MHDELGVTAPEMRHLKDGKAIPVRLPAGKHSEVGKHYLAVREPQDPHGIVVIVVAHTNDNGRNIVTVQKKVRHSTHEHA